MSFVRGHEVLNRKLPVAVFENKLEAQPLNTTGSIASPLNPVAIK
jgi:hypothetical protein